MITSFEVGSIFKIIDQATPTLKLISGQVKLLDAQASATLRSLAAIGSINLAQATGEIAALTQEATSLGLAFKDIPRSVSRLTSRTAAIGTMTTALGDQAKVVQTLGAEWLAVASAATAAGAATRRAARASVPLVAAPPLGGVVPPVVVPGSGGRHGPRQGFHVSGVSARIPGGHAHFRGGGNAAMATLGAVAYGVYHEAEVEDVAARALITGQIAVDKNMKSTDAFKRLRDVITKTSTATGFSPKEVGEAILTTERQFGGLDFMKRMRIEEELLPYAAAEARLKETTLPEAFKALVGMVHMTGTYKPEELPKLAKQFGYASMITPVPLPQFERALSYSLPILHAGMGMDPGTAMFLTAMTETAGITSTKSGTWIREFFSRTMPDNSGTKRGIAHNAALEKLGLLKDGVPTWMVKDASGATDWMASVGKLSGTLSTSLKDIPDTERLGVLRQTFGAQGGGFGALMNLPQFVEQLPILAEKMKAFTGGEDVIGQLLEGSPVQKARTAFSELQVVLMDIGQVVLPPLTEALGEFSKALKAIREAWPEQGHVGGLPQPGSTGEALGKGMGVGAVGGAIVGGIAGLFGGPFAPASVPAGMAWGALYGAGLVGALYGAGHVVGAAGAASPFAPMGGLEFMPMGPSASPSAFAGSGGKMAPAVGEPAWLKDTEGFSGGMKGEAPTGPGKLTLNIAPPPPAQVQIEAVPVTLMLDNRKLSEAVLQFVVQNGHGPAQGSPYPDATRGGTSIDFALA